MELVNKWRMHRFLEFFVVGFLMGIAEDLITIHFATDAAITPQVILIAGTVALPFAVFSELIVDWKHHKYVCEHEFRALKKRVKTVSGQISK